VKFAIGNPELTFTQLFCELTDDPTAFVAFKLTLKLPIVKVNDGFCDVLAVGYAVELVPTPTIVQFHEVGIFQLVSVNVTPSGVVPVDVTGVNDDTGSDGM
jgi:hypothetical protein